MQILDSKMIDIDIIMAVYDMTILVLKYKILQLIFKDKKRTLD